MDVGVCQIAGSLPLVAGRATLRTSSQSQRSIWSTSADRATPVKLPSKAPREWLCRASASRPRREAGGQFKGTLVWKAGVYFRRSQHSNENVLRTELMRGDEGS